MQKRFLPLVLLSLFLMPLTLLADERAEPKRSYGSVDVILYETSWCPYCKKARALLQDMGVSLVSYDIEADRTKRAEMLKKSGGSRGVPVIDIEGIVLQGYSAEEIRDAVENQRRK